MYPVLQQQAIQYNFKFPVLQQQQVISYQFMYPVLQQQHQFMLIRKNRNRFCIRNQNEQQRYAPLRSKPARDRVIDFGKHKGKMLGSLPSKYLKWVSKNLRARDFKEWAILADQVLVDPIYRDRIEWEFALNVLEGNSRSRSGSSEPGGASQLEEISQRFGWDYADKIGWSKVHFDLLGTSMGGRIPRIENRKVEPADVSQPNLSPAATSNSSSIGPSRSRRMERRRSRTTHEQQEQKLNVVVPAADNKQVAKPFPGRQADNKQVANPFPGRQALVRKAINHRAQS